MVERVILFRHFCKRALNETRHFSFLHIYQHDSVSFVFMSRPWTLHTDGFSIFTHPDDFSSSVTTCWTTVILTDFIFHFLTPPPKWCPLAHTLSLDLPPPFKLNCLLVLIFIQHALLILGSMSFSMRFFNLSTSFL